MRPRREFFIGADSASLDPCERLVPYVVTVVQGEARILGLDGIDLDELIGDCLCRMVDLVRTRQGQAREEGVDLDWDHLRASVGARMRGQVKDHLSSRQPLGYRSRGHWKNAPAREGLDRSLDALPARTPRGTTGDHDERDEVESLVRLSGLDGAPSLRRLAELVAYDGLGVAEAAVAVGMRPQDAQTALRSVGATLKRKLVARRLNRQRAGVAN